MFPFRRPSIPKQPANFLFPTFHKEELAQLQKQVWLLQSQVETLQKQVIQLQKQNELLLLHQVTQLQKQGTMVLDWDLILFGRSRAWNGSVDKAINCLFRDF